MSARKRPSVPPVPPHPGEDAATTVYDTGQLAGPRTGPIQVISMKTPGEGPPRPEPAQATPAIKRPKLRAISEVTPLPSAQPANLGYLAPPRDPAEVRARRVRELVLWSSVAVIVASAVALAIWFLAR